MVILEIKSPFSFTSRICFFAGFPVGEPGGT